MIGVSVRSAHRVRVEPAHHSLADCLEAGSRHQLDQTRRPVRRDDVRRGARQGGPRRHHRAVRRDVQELEVHAMARQRVGAPPAESRHQGAVVGPPEVQRARQRHRLPDRVGLHRPDDAGAAAGGQFDRRPGRPCHELRRWALRRHVLQRHVRGGVLRNRSAQGRRSGARVDSRRQRLRESDPRRDRLVSGRTGLAQDLAQDHRQMGSRRRLPGRRAGGIQHRRAVERRVRRAGSALRRRRLQQDARSLGAIGPGLRLQPVERRRHSWRDHRLRRHS